MLLLVVERAGDIECDGLGSERIDDGKGCYVVHSASVVEKDCLLKGFYSGFGVLVLCGETF